MRHLKGSSFVRRASLIAACALVAAVIAAPAAAFAATHSTLSVSKIYMPVSASFTMSGRMPSSTHGKSLTVEIRKPGRTYYTPVNTVKIGSTGRWSFKYFPKLGGSFYIRVRYGTSRAGLSRTAKLIVRKGPGKKYEVVLASTTSTQDSGLFEALLPMMAAQMPEYTFKATFIGSGAAIHQGLDGNADVVLAHSPAAERDALLGIYSGTSHIVKAIRRYKVMYNDYVLVGPISNPAGIALGDSAITAFNKIAESDSVFWSRNDASGTNAKEKEIWALCTPANPQVGQSWYKASGTMGMAQALAAANDGSTGGYTVADRATWLNVTKMGGTANLKIVSEGDPRYNNQYSVMEFTGARNAEGGREFAFWIRNATAQGIIRTYGLSTFGKALFTPNQGAY
jgi:tungstate transport system substrate-binding protein